MLKRLGLKNFKNFKSAELSMGPFTLLVGANAAGKSNIRDALRCLHAVGRRYSLAEIFGGKWSAGEQQWNGIRGGLREAAFRGVERFAIEAEMEGPTHNAPWIDSDMLFTEQYALEIDARSNGPPRIARESLYGGTPDDIVMTYDSHPARDPPVQKYDDQIVVKVLHSESPRRAWVTHSFSAERPVLGQVLRRDDERLKYIETTILDALDTLSAMRFIELSPEAMRVPSAPGQRVLSEKGENLSSVLNVLSTQEDVKAQIIQWLRLLTPMDVTDLQFAADVRGHLLLMLVERDGSRCSAYSASDGTLRFLGMLAVLFSPEPGLVFLEEIENGLHPTRLRLLLDLIRSRTRHGKVQVVATTHSPLLLASLEADQLEHVSLVYRNEGDSSAQITRILDVPNAARVLKAHDRGDLLASGWFEDMVEFGSTPQEPSP